jgi:fucose permease
MFPSIFSLGIEGLGPLTGKGSGLLVMAIVGGAIIPVAEGALADRIGIHHAFILPALCYVYIAYYGYKGSVQTSRALARWPSSQRPGPPGFEVGQHGRSQQPASGPVAAGTT